MHFRFLGTGAADCGTPAVGFDNRAYASLLINDRVLIDGTMRVLEKIGNPARITDILYTHSHADHYDPQLLAALAPVCVHAHRSWAGEIDVPGIVVMPFDVCSDFAVCDLLVTALPANHSTARAYETPVHFVIRGGGRTVFYATDGAWLRNEEWHALQNEALDAAIFDATVGEMYPSDYRIFEHNTVGMVRLIVGTLRNPRNGPNPTTGSIGPVLKPDAKVYLTHIGRTLHPGHEKIAESCAGEFIVAYDGLAVAL